MTDERFQALADVLSKDPENTTKLFELSPEAALEQINASGYDFTVDELKEMAQAMVSVSSQANGELDADDLDNVSGGALTVATVSCVCALVKLGAPYAWKAGQWIGGKIVGR